MRLQISTVNQNFIISSTTLALQTIQTEHRIKTLVYERNERIMHPRKPLHIVRGSCHFYGTSYQVTTANAKKFLANRKKTPIVLAFEHGIPIVLIPTHAASSLLNTWICLHGIKNIKAANEVETIIQLTNNQTITVFASEASISRQIALAYLLKREYTERFQQFSGV